MYTIVANMNKILSNVTVLLLCSLFASPSHIGTDTHTLFYCGQIFKALSDYPPKISKFKIKKIKKNKKVLYEKTCASLNLIPYSEQLSKLFSRFKKKKKALRRNSCQSLIQFQYDSMDTNNRKIITTNGQGQNGTLKTVDTINKSLITSPKY